MQLYNPHNLYIFMEIISLLIFVGISVNWKVFPFYLLIFIVWFDSFFPSNIRIAKEINNSLDYWAEFVYYIFHEK